MAWKDEVVGRGGGEGGDWVVVGGRRKSNLFMGQADYKAHVYRGRVHNTTQLNGAAEPARERVRQQQHQ